MSPPRAIPAPGVLFLATLLALSLPVAVVAVSAPAAAASGPPDDAANPCVGTTAQQPDESTLVSIQGAELTDDGYEKRPALLVSYAPDGTFQWARNASAAGRWWAYDVDPLPNGNALFVTTEPGATVVGELDPATGTYEWTERFEGTPDDPENPLVTDAHDADLIHGDELVVADKGQGHERLLVYNRTRGEVTWEWRFEDHPEAFPESGGGPPDDWTHVNDVDRVNVSESDAVDATGEWFVASVRNFDQVVFVNRSSGAVELTLGEDGNHDVLHRQHNPDHLWGPDGEHTMLVADSLNDRVVEYEYHHGNESWERVWSVTGLNEPRDADRLPNGNTLVSDRMGHRVVEVTPDGEVVWEVYTPYETYDAERGSPGSNGPTMRERGVEGRYEVHGDAAFSESEVDACANALYEFAPSRVDAIAGDVTGREIHRGESVPVVPVAVGAIVVLLVVAGAVVYRQRTR
jgi:hypothetical protein